MSANPTDSAMKLLSAITTATAVLAELNPSKHSTEKETLKQAVMRMRDVYARLMTGTQTTQPGGG